MHTEPQIVARLLVIGDEILSGHTRDGNIPLLARRLHRYGVPLLEVSIVPDGVDEISMTLRRMIEHDVPQLLITTGGVGPTPDDVTYEAVAQALGVRLRDNRQIMEWIDVWTADQVSGPEEMRLQRLARIPEGSRLVAADILEGPVAAIQWRGGAHAGGSTIVMLPGATDLIRDVLDRGIEQEIIAGLCGDPEEVRDVDHELHEGQVVWLVEELIQRFPKVSVGSYPGYPNKIRLRSRSHADLSRAQSYLEGALKPGTVSEGRGTRGRGFDQTKPLS